MKNKHLKFYSSIISSTVICFNALAIASSEVKLKSEEQLIAGTWLKCSIQSSGAVCSENNNNTLYEIITDQGLIKKLAKEVQDLPTELLAEAYLNTSFDETSRIIQSLSLGSDVLLNTGKSPVLKNMTPKQLENLKDVISKKSSYKSMKDLYQDKETGISKAMTEEEFSRLISERGLSLATDPNSHPVGLVIIGLIAGIGIILLSDHNDDNTPRPPMRDPRLGPFPRPEPIPPSPINPRPPRHYNKKQNGG